MSGAYLRDHFPILKTKVHLASCSQGPISTEVMRALDEYKRSLLEYGMVWENWLEEVAAAKEEFASLIGADSREIAVFSSVSDAVSSVSSCLPIYGRNRILTTPYEFPTVGQAWLAAAHHNRAEVIFTEPSPDRLYLPEQIEPYLSSYNIALFSVHHVSYYNATLQDIKGLTEVAHRYGTLILVDAYQGLGTVPLSVKEADVDILVSGALKYLLGIPGIAFMYVSSKISDDLQPGITGWFGRVNPFNFDTTRLDFARGARRFDMGTPPIIAAYAARSGLQLIKEVGVSEIRRHTLNISSYIIEGASERGLKVVSPLEVEKKGAAVAIWVGQSSGEIEKKLFERGIIVSARADVIRLAPHFFTTFEDIDLALDALAEEMSRLRT